MSFSKPKAPKEDPQAAVLRERQVSDLAKIDEQQNIKIKRMLNASRGARVFAGSAASRAAPMNAAGKPLFTSRGTSSGAATGGSAQAGGGTMAGGGRGSAGNTYSRA